MEQVIGTPIRKRKGLFKALIFLAFIISTIILIRFTPVKD